MLTNHVKGMRLTHCQLQSQLTAAAAATLIASAAKLKRAPTTSSPHGSADASLKVDESDGDACSDSSSSFDAAGFTPKERTPRNRALRTPRGPRAIKETSDNRVRRLHPEIHNVWLELGKSEILEHPPIQQPIALRLPLLPFQREGVAWMLYQEEHSVFHGGILADDMGMGKTIQTIALMLARPCKPTGRFGCGH